MRFGSDNTLRKRLILNDFEDITNLRQGVNEFSIGRYGGESKNARSEGFKPTRKLISDSQDCALKPLLLCS
jgi:hypothetical protein